MTPHKQQSNCLNITAFLSPGQFESITRFILENGDRKTYRNMDSNNPHYRLKSFDLYLNPEDTRRAETANALPYFNEIVIYDPSHDIQYFIIRIVRNGNTGGSETDMFPACEPGHTYLLNPYDEDIVKMKEALLNRYLVEILTLVSGTR